MCKEIDSIEFFENIELEINKIKQEVPYHFNVIDELYINENSNTRILMKLLQYQKDSKFPILISFIILFSKLINNSIEVKNPKLYVGLDFIDGLIEDISSGYAIILENKIYNAPDQQKQIERYISTVESHGFKTNNIYVIYLTKDENKKISASSFTTIAKKKLGFTNDEKSGRYIQINYKRDILPWLKNQIIPEFTKEEFLSSGIFQYIDYLEGFFDIRKIDKIMKEKVNEILENRLQLKEKSAIENLEILTKKIEDIDSLQNSLHDLKNQYIYEICKDFILPDLEKFSKKYGFEIENDSLTFQDLYIQIILTHPSWKKCNLVFQTERQQNLFGLIYKDKNKPIAEKSKRKLANENSNISDWWPFWQFTNNNFKYINEDFWLSISRGDFSKYLIGEFKNLNNIILKNNLRI